MNSKTYRVVNGVGDMAKWNGKLVEVVRVERRDLYLVTFDGGRGFLAVPAANLQAV